MTSCKYYNWGWINVPIPRLYGYICDDLGVCGLGGLGYLKYYEYTKINNDIEKLMNNNELASHLY